MGALHEGHASLVRQAVSLSDARGLPGGCVVSIFVNPTQFNEAADFARYPRTLEADLALCRAAGAAFVYAPDAAEVYPPSKPIPVPALPSVATRPGLEDASRPGHFAGVCQVVARLFELVRPVAAIFGEKDWQQLQVVTALVEQLRLPIDIIPGVTVREADGLAMSSRNRFLAPGERAHASVIARALTRAAACTTPEQAESLLAADILSDGTFAELEYAVVRDARTLESYTPGRPGRALVAARLGSIRLIDNAPWPARSV